MRESTFFLLHTYCIIKACPHLLRKAVHSSLHHTGNTVTTRTARVSSLHIQAFGHETGNRQQSKVPLLYKNTDGLRHDIHKNHCSRKQPLHIRPPEWFLTIKLQRTVQVDSCTSQSIVGTFHITFVEQNTFCPIQRIHIQAADETDIFCHNFISMTIATCAWVMADILFLRPNSFFKGNSRSTLQ